MGIENLSELAVQLRQFAEERDWNQFHTPKNLAAALSVEASELLEIYQWLTPNQASNLDAVKRGRVAEELADVLMYTVRLADITNIDLLEAAQLKLEKNAQKYPADLVKGSAKKYTEY